MARYVFVVLTNPTEGNEDDFNEWYTNEHLTDVLKLPGFLSAQRFRFAPKDPVQTAPYRYLALYEIETDDLATTHQNLVDVARTEQMPFSPAIDDSDLIGWYFEPITERVVPAKVGS